MRWSSSKTVNLQLVLRVFTMDNWTMVYETVNVVAVATVCHRTDGSVQFNRNKVVLTFVAFSVTPRFGRF